MKKNGSQFTYTVSGQDGSELPGLNLVEMRRRIVAGEVTGATFVRRSDGEHWATASDFAELAIKDVVVGRYDNEGGPDALTQEMEEAGYARTIRTGAGWFFWIAAMSFLNTVLAFLGSWWQYALGLSISAPIGELGLLLGAKVSVFALLANLALVFLFFFFGVAGWKKRFFPYVIGMGLYAGDTVGAYLSGDWLSVFLHIVALLYLYWGLKAHMLRRDMGVVKILVPFLLSLTLLSGAGFFLNSRMHPTEKEPVGSEPWARKPHKEWPALVLSHDAEFRGHSALSGGSAFLLQLSEDEIIAVSAKHLLGEDGGVAPPLRVSELAEVIEKWQLHPRSDPANAIEVTGLFGRPSHYNSLDDCVLLEVETTRTTLPTTALKLRYKPLDHGETIYVVGVRYDNPKQEQEVFEAKVTGGSYGFIEGKLQKPVNLEGFSGAPVLDSSGHIVGFVTSTKSEADKNGNYETFVGRSSEEISRLLRAAALSK